MRRRKRWMEGKYFEGTLPLAIPLKCHDEPMWSRIANFDHHKTVRKEGTGRKLVRKFTALLKQVACLIGLGGTSKTWQLCTLKIWHHFLACPMKLCNPTSFYINFSFMLFSVPNSGKASLDCSYSPGVPQQHP
jgi:hypothetical protein